MKSLMRKTMSIMLAATCMVGTAAFADTNGTPEGYDGNVYDETSIQVIEMEACSAIDLLGGIPEIISGPDREDLEVILAEIDEYNAAGDYEMANELWETVYAILSQYECESTQPEENQSDEEMIEDMIASLEERIQRYEAAGEFEMAEELRAELDRILMEVYGEQDQEEPIDPDAWEDPDAFEDPQELEDPDMPEGSEAFPVEHLIAELEAEINRLEEMGAFEEVDALRAELERLFAELEGDDPGMEHDEHQPMNPEDVDIEQIIAETEAEIGRLEDAGEFEAADALRAELEGFLNEFHGEEHDMHMDSENDSENNINITVEDILNKVGHDVAPENMEILQYLVNEINELF